MRGMLSLLGGFGTGYNEGVDRQQQVDRQNRMDQVVLQRAAREQQEYDRETRVRAELEGAGAPVQAVPAPAMDMPANDDEGNPMPAVAPVVSVNGARMGVDQGKAAVAAANDPAEVRKRQIGVLQKYDPAKAAQMTASDMTLQNQQMELATKKWNNDVEAARASGLQGLIDFTNKSHADGQGGAEQSKAIVSDDGKTFTIHTVNPDGSTTPTKMPPLPNNERGWDTLAASLTHGITPQQRLAHWAQVDAEERKAKSDDRKERHDMVMEELMGRKVDSAEEMAKLTLEERRAAREGREADRAERNDIRREKQSSVVERMPERDKIAYKQATEAAAKLDEEINKSILNSGGMVKETDPSVVALRKRQRDLAVQADSIYNRSAASSAAAPSADPARFSDPQSPTRRGMQVPPATQAARDSKAVELVAGNEYAGPDGQERARSDIAAIQAELKTAKTGDHKSMLNAQLAKVQAALTLSGQPRMQPAAAAEAARKTPGARPMAVANPEHASLPMDAVITDPTGAVIGTEPAAGPAPRDPMGTALKSAGRRILGAADSTASAPPPELQARVIEAARGGRPLTEYELTLAKQYRMI